MVEDTMRPRNVERRDASEQRPTSAPKPLDDVTLARKVESVALRDLGGDKRTLDVNVADSVVRLRGEAETPELSNQLERRAAELPEARTVENLLHLPKTPAPSRADTPASQRKTPRSPRQSAARKVQAGKLSAEGTTASKAAPAPREVARADGLAAAPLGAREQSEGSEAKATRRSRSQARTPRR